MADDEKLHEDRPGQDRSQAERPARRRGDRHRKDDDAIEQLVEIEEAQKKVRQGKSKGIIDSIEISKQRVKRQLDDIRSLDDLNET